MKKKILIIVGVVVPTALLFGAAVIGYQDWQLRGSAPGNPASGFLRVWADTTGQFFNCITSLGLVCHFDPKATTSTLGIVQPDGTTITISSGVISSTATTVVHGVGANFDGAGSALTVGTNIYFTVPFACTITAWNMTVDTGTATIDAWKISTGTAIPTIANTITASATPAISTGTALHSTTLTGWTTGVSANDIVAFDITAVASATKASLVLQCQ